MPVTIENNAGKEASLEDSLAGPELYICSHYAINLRHLCTRSASHQSVSRRSQPQNVRVGLSSKEYDCTKGVLFVCSLTFWTLPESRTNIIFAWTETLRYFSPQLSPATFLHCIESISPAICLIIASAAIYCKSCH